MASACCRSAPACRAGRRRWPGQWRIAEETAAKHGKTVDRKKWRVVVNAHVAEDDEQALRRGPQRRAHRDRDLFRGHAGPPARPRRRSAARGREDGHDAGRLAGDGGARASSGCSAIQQGGFGGILFRAHEWANREQTMRSYELFARYVMPRFQGSLDTIVGVARLGEREPQDDLRPERRCGEKGVHRCRPRSAGGIFRPGLRRAGYGGRPLR